MKNETMFTSPFASHRQRQLEECMYQNLLKTPYASISVQELCSQVGISRRAFYNYFKDKDECLCSMLDHLFRECYLQMVAVAAQSGTRKEICTTLMEYRKNNRTFMEAIVRNDLYPFLIRSMLRFAREEPAIIAMLSTPEHQADDYDVACFIGCQLALHLQWFSRGYDTSPEEMAEIFLRTAYSPFLTDRS